MVAVRPAWKQNSDLNRENGMAQDLTWRCSRTCPRGSPPISVRAAAIHDAANAPVQKRISIWLESNVVPPMSPSLVKWISHCIAFCFQDWFMLVQDIQPGRGSIAVKRNPYGLPRVWVFTRMLLTPSCFLSSASFPWNVRKSCSTVSSSIPTNWRL